jgi:hypothetical protein
MNRLSKSSIGLAGLALAMLGAWCMSPQPARATVPPDGTAEAQDPGRPDGRRPRRGAMAGPREMEGQPPPHADGPRDGKGPRPMGDRFGPGPGGEPGRRGGPPPELSDELLDKVMALVGEKFPVMHERLTRLRQENPERFRMAIGRMVGVYREFQALKERQPEMAEMLIQEIRNEERLRELAEQYQAAMGDAPRQGELETAMQEVVRQQVEFMLKRHEARLADFAERIAHQQARLAEEQARLADEKSRIDELVTQRVEDIKSGNVRPMRGPKEGRGRGGPGFGGPGFGGPRGRGGPDEPGAGEPGLRMRDGRGRGLPPPPPPDDDEDLMPPPPPEE